MENTYLKIVFEHITFLLAVM